MKQSLCFLNRNVCPPDGFRYTFPEDGYVVQSWTYDAWKDSATAHARANEMEPPTGEEMEEQMCKILPPGWCSYDQPNPIVLSMTWDDVKQGLTTFGRWISEGQNLVPQEEADRRALICSRCYFNLPVSGCAACHAAVQSLLGKVNSRYDPFLRACGVCKCLLKAKIHFPISILDRESDKRQEMYPGHCWLKRTGENYRG